MFQSWICTITVFHELFPVVVNESVIDSGLWSLKLLLWVCARITAAFFVNIPVNHKLSSWTLVREERAHLIFQSRAAPYLSSASAVPASLGLPKLHLLLRYLALIISYILSLWAYNRAEPELKLLHRAPHQGTSSHISLTLKIIWANKVVKPRFLHFTSLALFCNLDFTFNSSLCTINIVTFLTNCLWSSCVCFG